MDDGLESILDGSESGSKLRTLLAAAHKELRETKAEASALRAKDLIVSKGFTYVKPEDLAGVEIDDLESKATELEALKTSERKALEVDVLKGLGIPEDQIESVVANLTGSPEAERASALKNVRDIGRTVGTAAPSFDDQNLHGFTRILAALESKAK